MGLVEKQGWIHLRNFCIILGTIIIVTGYKLGRSWEINQTTSHICTIIFFIIWIIITFISDFYVGKYLGFFVESDENKSEKMKEKNFKRKFIVLTSFDYTTSEYNFSLLENTKNSLLYIQYSLNKLFSPKKNLNSELASFKKEITEWFSKEGVFLDQKFDEEIKSCLKKINKKID
eukprot:Anaeramoba_ignava/c1028_g1_i1.p1 GENE.c1028_g1_i1~~c1028_g1_i1.p1  ORF type:complete len:175 (+),score=43.05 c1028_g1_i1:179-703(+)